MRGWIVSVVVLATGCDTLFSLQHLDQGPLHSKQITIAPQQITGPVVNTQVSVWLQNDVDLAGYVSDASYIGFTDSDGNPLNCEIASYTAGNLDAWVALPMIPAAGITFDLVFGSVEQACLNSNVWPIGIVGVWHEPDSQGLFLDKSLHHHDASPLRPINAPSIVDGIVGNGGSYDGMNDSACVQQTAGDTSLDFGKMTFSYSVWVNVTTSAGMYDEPLSKGGEDGTAAGFSFALGAGPWQTHLDDGTTTSPIGVMLTDAPRAGWTQLVTVVDRDSDPGSVSVYTNGSLSQTTPLPASFGSVTNQTRNLCLGGPSLVFEGILDEARVYSTLISTDRIVVEYQNLANRAQFMTIGPDQVDH